ncbi:MAG: DUF1015 domain-containing protein [Actinomycetaceae bacterium]|nr:DUF1015 domain-containing protein [Actinomycetaceae bacterium]
MTGYAEKLAAVGVNVPTLLVPKKGVDLNKWSVVACDQFTSQPEYWEAADEFVGDAPSALRLVYPEAYLGEADPQARIDSINATMQQYVDNDLFDIHENTMFLVRRTMAKGHGRWGLILALDLEHYSWEPDSTTLIRATEGTILDRIPPRKVIRQNAALELPHIMVLIDDPDATVIEPLAAKRDSLPEVYDTDLMLDGGHVQAWAITDDADLDQIADALTGLYKKLDPANPLLFAMGDGNHSLATAKSIWMDVRETIDESEWEGHPARYCLVELENIFDDGLTFEAIHRVMFNTKRADFEAELAKHCASFDVTEVADLDAMLEALETMPGQTFGYGDADGLAVYTVNAPEVVLAAATLQRVIDAMLADGTCPEVDYIHGDEVTLELGQRPGNLGFLLSPISKDTFFASMIADGVLPRKTFSMGDAEEKRYYMEARRIK